MVLIGFNNAAEFLSCKRCTCLLYTSYEENFYIYHNISIFVPIEVICSDRYMDYVSPVSYTPLMASDKPVNRQPMMSDMKSCPSPNICTILPSSPTIQFSQQLSHVSLTVAVSYTHLW